MTDLPRCEDCDKPIAGRAEYDSTPEGGGDEFCWREYNSGICQELEIDWRGRALAAEAELVRRGVPAPRRMIDDIRTALDDAKARGRGAAVPLAQDEVEELLGIADAAHELDHDGSLINRCKLAGALAHLFRYTKDKP